MRRRIRLAAVGSLAIAAIATLTSTAGAAGPGITYSTSANGGFISLSLLNLIGLSGAGSSANSSSNGTDSASGTGLCLAAPTVNDSTCPNTTNATSADVLNTTANASASSSSPGTDAPAPNCLVPPTTLLIITLEAACGRASATEDAAGDPTASGEGDLAKVDVTLGAAIPGLGSLLGNGTLCGAASSPGNSTSTSSGLLGGLLGTVNNLLGGLNLPLLSNATSSGGGLGSVCGILSGLTSELPIVGGLLSNSTASSDLLSITVGDSTSTITNSTAAATTATETAGDKLVTTTATTEAVDVNVLGLLDVKVLPNIASITVDTTNGQVQQPFAQVGVLSVQEGAGLPTVIALPDLSGLLNNLLSALGGALVNPQLTTVAESATTLDAAHQNGTAEAADLKLNLLAGLVVLNLGDAKVAASTSTAAPLIPIVTQPAVASVVTSPAAAVVPSAAVVPNVTTVHTGEFWAGSLPIFLLSGMGLAGILLIGRRRVFDLARSVTPFSRRR
jgi:hypothetical protein